MRTLMYSLCLALATGLLVACSSSSSNPAAASARPTVAAAAGQVLTVQGTDTLKFEPANLTVKAGQPVQLTFSNTGQMLHDWSLVEGPAQPVKIIAAGGTTASATFTIARPGTYTFVCSQPGHESGGMRGTITAQ